MRSSVSREVRIGVGLACPRGRYRLAPDHGSGLASNRCRWEVERNGQILPDAQFRVRLEAAGHLDRIGVVPELDETERFRAERLDQQHLAIDPLDAGRAARRDADVLGPQAERDYPADMARTLRDAARGHRQVDTPGDVQCAPALANGTARSSSAGTQPATN
jgi:hypothetical protein